MSRSIFERLEALEDQVGEMQMTLADLQTQVAANTSLEQSAITLITGLAAQIAALAQDPAAIQALATELSASAAALSAAITANVPPPPAPKPTP